MQLPIYQVDAFAERVFEGNPAAVVPLSSWLPDETMQAIAMENQLSETAFFLPEGEGYALRWFTPTTEVDLCGHATLATAHVLFTEEGVPGESIRFSSRSGILTVNRLERGYSMDFPLDRPGPASELPAEVTEALGATVKEVLRGREDLVAVLESESEVRSLAPAMENIRRLDARGILVTAPGDGCDFVSRCFFPRFGIDEDPVTGSAHTTLAPFWAEVLKTNSLSARQISERGGNVHCHIEGDRISLSGNAVTYLQGRILVP
ncbi:MAG: PhzF family phenazine biosynthesis protein [Verrucomicrobiales bacterium]|nr:PhzF family phenazine biosynthesis protein [Verrucomicrobiales bacterium]